MRTSEYTTLFCLAVDPTLYFDSNTAGALDNPNGILRNSLCKSGAMNAVFSIDLHESVFDKTLNSYLMKQNV